MHLRANFVLPTCPGIASGRPVVPFSLSLPLHHEGDFIEGAARLFFANLLPEGRQRELIARHYGLSPGNDFGLLQEIGGDCAGAVSLLPEDEAPPAAGQGYRPLDRAGLQAVVQGLPRHPLLVGDAEARLSLAGAQAKLPIWYRDGAFAIPIGGPSTHILKRPIAGPDAEGLSGSVHNEAFVMRLAGEIGLSVPRVEVLDLEPMVLLVERSDRTVDTAGGLQRVHQEDFCQALGYSPDRKYEADGGPRLADVFSQVRRSVLPPVQAVGALLDWVLFNYLVGNADAHAKNVSLLLLPGGPRLAPFYDLLSTAAWDTLTTRLAMKVGGEARPEWVRARNWQRFAQESDLARRLVRDRLHAMAERLPERAGAVRTRLEAEAGSHPVMDRIEAVIAARCRWALVQWGESA